MTVTDLRTITITLPDAIAEELEAGAKTSGRSLADFAGEKFALAYDAIPKSLPGEGAPNTTWVNGKPVYVRPDTPPAWLTQIEPENPPTDGTNGLHCIVGQWPGDETDEEIEAALERLS